MSAQPHEVDQEVNPATAQPGPKRVQALIAISADQLRRLSVRRQFRGYNRDDIDYAIGRAAQTIDDLADELLKVYAEVGARPELRGVDAGTPAHSTSPAPLDLQSSSVSAASPTCSRRRIESPSRGIRTAHEERDRILEQAEKDAEPLREEIARRRASLTQLQGDGDALVERAQLLANTLLDAARGERDRLLSSTVDDIEKTRPLSRASGCGSPRPWPSSGNATRLRKPPRQLPRRCGSGLAR